MLHKLNPVRLGYIREQINLHFGVDAKSLRPLAEMTALDVGCGAGLLAEPLARMGAAVTGVDAAPESIAVAKAHAAGQGLSIDYRACEVADLDTQPRTSRAKSRDALGVSTSLDTNGTSGSQFDLITAMEVIEHVTDPVAFIAALSARLAPGGLMILSTPNRTVLSRIGLITIGEGLGQIPKGTHDWDKFLTPEELTALLREAGLAVINTRGISFNVGRGLVLSDDVKLNYLMSVTAA